MKITKEELANIIKEEVEKAMSDQGQQISNEDKTVFVVAAVYYLTEYKIDQIPKPTKGDRQALVYYREAIHDLDIEAAALVCRIIKDYNQGDMGSIERSYSNFSETDKKDLNGAIKKKSMGIDLKNIRCSGY